MSTVLHLYLSPGHNYFGHHGKAPGTYPMLEVPEVECIAGKGIRGDRFFDYKPDYKGQITFFAWEVYEEVCHQLGVFTKNPSVFRRNVITQGLPLHTLIGKEFELQGIRFRGTGECAPCYWMNQAFAPEAEAALQGRGGLRAQILSHGILHTTSRAPSHAP